MSSYSDESIGLGEIAVNAVKGFGISVICAAALLFAFTGIAYKAEDPSALIPILGYGALYISSAVAGGTASRVSGDSGGVAVLSAAISGVLMLTLLIMMSFLPAETTVKPLSPIIAMAMYAAVPAAAAVAGILFRRKQTRRKGRGPMPRKNRRH